MKSGEGIGRDWGSTGGGVLSPGVGGDKRGGGVGMLGMCVCFVYRCGVGIMVYVGTCIRLRRVLTC